MKFQSIVSNSTSRLSVSLLTLTIVCFGLSVESAIAQRRTGERTTSNSNSNKAPAVTQPGTSDSGNSTSSQRSSGSQRGSSARTVGGGVVSPGGDASLLGSYTATTTGKSGATGSGGATGVGRGGGMTQGGGQAAGTALTIQIDRFVSEAEYQAAVSASDVAAAISNMNCGTVRLNNGPAIKINLAAAVKTSLGPVAIYLLSEQPFSTSGNLGTASGGTVGFIEMRMGGDAGNGSMYSSTQVVVQSGSIVARGGASTATQLTIAKGSVAATSAPSERTNNAVQGSGSQRSIYKKP